MNRIYYYAHMLLQSRIIYLFYFFIIMFISSIFNTITYCEVDNDNVVNEEIVKKNNYDYIGLILFSTFIIFNIFVLPTLLDGTFFEKYIGIIFEDFDNTFDDMCKPVTQEELDAVKEAAEEWLKRDLRELGLSEKDIQIFFGIYHGSDS